MIRSEAPSLLIVEDDHRFLSTLTLELEDLGYRVIALSSVAEAQCFQDPSLKYAVIDLRLADGSGLTVVDHLRNASPNCRILVLTGYGSIPTAVEAVKRGAVHYLTKPIRVDKLHRSLQGDLQSAADDSGVGESLARHERNYIEDILLRYNGNISRAAEHLGLHRQSLQRKLRKYPPK